MVKSALVNANRVLPHADRVDRQIGWLIFALTLGLYLRTLAPGLLAGDPGEFQFAAWRLGLAHPTGYPLYMLLGSLWQHLLALVGIQPTTALNAFSALAGAATVGLLYHLMRNWLPGPPIIQRMAAVFTAALFALNPTFWQQSLIAEVYALHTLFVVLILLAAQQVAGGRWQVAGAQVITNQQSQISSGPLVLQSSSHLTPPSPLHLFTLALAVGLSLTHHAMTLLLLPGLFVFLWLVDKRWWRDWRTLLLSGLAAVLPLLLYLYIPLRSGAEASPWYHQNLGGDVLTLYENTWPTFVNFMTGQSIAVGFRDWGDALQQARVAGRFWWLHFSWAGLVLVVAGLLMLLRQRRWLVLALTLSYVLCQQIFNLFYAIGDIHVYYISLYLMGAIWAGFAGASLGSRGVGSREWGSEGLTMRYGLVFVLALLLLPLYFGITYFAQVDQSGNDATRRDWAAILAAQLPDDAILISNDRNEIVPLFYLQSVEERAMGMTGLFPLMAPDARFEDIGTTIDTALTASAGRPVYLIKPMPGLDVRFDLAERTPPLVQVMGAVAVGDSAHKVGETYAFFTLIGYNWEQTVAGLQIDLHWLVHAPPRMALTSTVQFYGMNGEKIGQSDHPPGGVYYPTALWKMGEVLLDRHVIPISNNDMPTQILVGMYTSSDTQLLAPLLRLSWTEEEN